MIKKQGFTLIELLVVVLIIGVLAAIALPQYEVAVNKTRMAQMMIQVRAIKDTAEMYFLANGNYEDSLDGLDPVWPGDCQVLPYGKLQCPGFFVDLQSGEESGMVDIIGICKTCTGGSLFYRIWMDHSAHSGQQECWAAPTNIRGLRVCQSYGGNYLGDTQNTYPGYKRYSIP